MSNLQELDMDEPTPFILRAKSTFCLSKTLRVDSQRACQARHEALLATSASTLAYSSMILGRVVIMIVGERLLPVIV